MTQTQKKVSLVIIPELNNHSPTSVKDKLFRMNKSLYNSPLIPDRIEQLEKEALRGVGASIPEAKPHHKPKPKLDLLTELLKSEHKTNAEGTQIVKLPKLPYGNHKSYNEEAAFRHRHFIEKSSYINKERLSELEETTRKFRLNEKKNKGFKRSKLKTLSPMLNGLNDSSVYDMGPGSLVCVKQDEVEKTYNQEKERYGRISISEFSATYKDFERSEKGRFLMRRTIDWQQTKELLERLMPVRTEKKSRLGKFYEKKYSCLFEENKGRVRGGSL